MRRRRASMPAPAHVQFLKAHVTQYALCVEGHTRSGVVAAALLVELDTQSAMQRRIACLLLERCNNRHPYPLSNMV